MLAPGIIIPCYNKICIRVISLAIVFVHSITSAQQKSYRVYTADDGLVSNHIQSVFQDADGFVWFATFNGISIYDGHRFVNYTADNGGLTSNIVFGFFQKSDDEVWVIENSATDIFRGRTRAGSIPIKGFELSNYINTREGRTLVARDHYVYDIRNCFPEPIAKFPHYFTKIFAEGNNFIIQSDSVLIVNRSFTQVIDALPGRIFKDRLNRFWILDKDFYLLDTTALKDGSFKLMRAPINLSNIKVEANAIHDFLPDADGFYWLFIENRGVLRIDAQGNSASYDFTRQYLDKINFTEDAEGNVWVPGKGGVIKFYNKYADIYSSEKGLTSDFVTSISEDGSNKSVWAALRKGIACIYRDSVYNFRYPTEYFSWTTLMVQHDSLWVCLDKLYLYKIKYNPQPQLIFVRKWSPGVVPAVMMTCLHQDRTGSMLVTIDDDGLYRVSMSGKIQKVQDETWSFCIDGDELWTGTKYSGAARWKMIYEGDSLRLELIQKFDQLSDDHVRSIVKDESGNFWMARLKKGIAKFERRGNGSFDIRQYNFKQGLLNGWVWKTWLLNDGSMYICTLGGLFALPAGKDSLHFQSLSAKYGINREVYDIVGKTADNIWLASDIGIIHIRDNYYFPSKAPKVFFTKMLLNNQQDSAVFRSDSPNIYSYAKNNLSFEFSATSFRNENEVLYSYKLEKSHAPSQWSVPQRLHTLSLVSLSPGSYTLNVKAITGDNVESDTPARFSFIIEEPFWTTWWFRALGVALLAFVFFMIYKFRLRQASKVMAVRMKISRDLHDEIGSTLSGIGLISELVKEQLNNGNYAGAKQSVEKITAGAEEILGKISDIVWAINPQNDTFEKMVMRLKSYATSVAVPLNITIKFEVDAEFNRIVLSMQERNNIYLICKEAINNAIKYSSCNMIQFSLRNTDHQFQIEIKDNGKGFNVDHQYDGNGLKNMQYRAKEINASLTIVSGGDSGTLLKLLLRTV